MTIDTNQDQELERKLEEIYAALRESHQVLSGGRELALIKGLVVAKVNTGRGLAYALIDNQNILDAIINP